MKPSPSTALLLASLAVGCSGESSETGGLDSSAEASTTADADESGAEVGTDGTTTGDGDGTTTGDGDGTSGDGDGDGTTTGDGDGTSGDGDGTSGDGDGDGTVGDGDGDGTSGDPVGTPCTDAASCAGGVCWDISDYDPECMGAACSVGCSSDQDCVDAFTEVGASNAANGVCQTDGICDMASSGIFFGLLCA